MDWIHCNTCFTQPSEATKAQLFLTTCGHLFCDGCLKKATTKTCPMCNQVYASTILLSNEMKPDVQVYFTDPREVFKKGLKQIKLSEQIIEFQKGHSNRLHKYQKTQLTKASEMMKQAKDLERRYRQISMENEVLKHFVSSLGYKPTDIVQKIHTQGLPPTPHIMTTPNKAKTPNDMQMQGSMHASGMSQYPRSTPIQCRPPSPSMSPVAYMRQSQIVGNPMSSQLNIGRSPQRSNPMSSQINIGRSPQRNNPMSSQRSIGRSPKDGPSPMVTNERLSIRTPPINGKLGPVGSSPAGGFISPKNQLPLPSSQNAGMSKIAQMLGASRSYQPANAQLRTPILDGRRPIQVHSRPK